MDLELNLPVYEPTGTEPKVLVSDVQAILHEVIATDDDDDGQSVALIADKADTSTRTVYRVLQRKPTEKDPVPAISMDLADRLVLAADSHLAHCRLRWPDGTVTPYV